MSLYDDGVVFIYRGNDLLHNVGMKTYDVYWRNLRWVYILKKQS